MLRWSWPLLACALLLAACSARTPGLPAAPAEPSALEGPAESLPSLLFRSRQAKAFDLDLLYTPPPESALGQYAFQLVREPATLILFDQATAFQATDQSLAVALSDGTLRLFGEDVCAGLVLPGGAAPLVSWLPGSPWLAAAAADRESLVTADVRTCSLKSPRKLKGRVAALAVSPSGAWLAAAAEPGALWAGPPDKELRELGRLPAPCLALGFSQGDGLLAAACADGSVSVRTPDEGRLLKEFRAKDGPFQAARFTDGQVEFSGTDGRVETLDLAAGKPAGLSRRETGFSLKDGLLTYRTWYNAPLQKLLPGGAPVAVEYSARQDLLRVREPDGSLRCFAAKGRRPGEPAGCVEAQDWTAGDLDEDGRFCRKGRCYAVADRVFQLEHARLLCRFVPGQGFYLWWVRAERPNSGNPLQGHLPVRETLDPDETVRWIPLNPPANLP
jgi:hypothetical protein